MNFTIEKKSDQKMFAEVLLNALESVANGDVWSVKDAKKVIKLVENLNNQNCLSSEIVDRIKEAKEEIKTQ